MRCKKYMNMIMAKNFPRKIQDYKPESKKSQRTPIKINTKAHPHKQTYMGISQTNCRKTKIKISKTEKKNKYDTQTTKIKIFFRKLYKSKDNTEYNTF